MDRRGIPMIKQFKKICSYKFHVKCLINPFLKYQISAMENYSGVNENQKREPEIIISLTSYRERFKDLPATLYSLLNQSLKPDRIILWLNEEYEELTNLPYEITQFIKNGLEIKFVKDLGPYTKAIYSFKNYNNSIIVTADDDIYYPKNWLKKLYLSYIAHPKDIHVHRAHKVDLNLPYEKWEKHVVAETAEYGNFLTGVGGVLYPPCCFSKEVLREDIFLTQAPTADDIWFWVMALIHNRRIRVVNNHLKTLIATNIFQQLFSETLYNKNCNGKNDEQLKNLLKYYRQNIEIKLSQRILK